ncbi:hypothetical protein SAMN02744115_02382 [Cellulosimicrobium cellulans J1]|nr:hypothetical protein SAMN02744115_02382 [Cellulosimicrobium cellulans J1]
MTPAAPHGARPRAARRPRSLALLVALVVAATTACTAPAPPDDATTTTTPTPRTSPSEPAATEPTETEEPPASDDAGAAESPEEAFRAWLAASRAPDVEVACGYMEPALVDRMVAEMTAQGWPGITDCASMVTTTAALYAALGSVADVEIQVREERPDAVVLGVVYASGSCGSAVMLPDGSRWRIGEQSQEEC